MKKHIRLLGGTRGPKTAGATDLFLPGKEVKVSEIIQASQKIFISFSAKQKLLGKFVNTYHVKEKTR